MHQNLFFRVTSNTNLELVSWVVVHTFNPSTWEPEAGGSLSLRPTWSTERVLGKLGLHREALSPKKKAKKEGEREVEIDLEPVYSSVWFPQEFV